MLSVHTRGSSKRFWTGSKKAMLALAVIGAAGMSQLASAAVITWDGSDSTAWATGGNWVGGNAPADDLVTDIATFNDASYTNQPDAGTRSVNGITVGASSGALTISGTSLSIGKGGLTVASGAGTVTFSAPVTIAAAQSWTATASNTVTVTGAVTRGAGATIDFSTVGTFDGAGLLAAVGTTVQGWATIGGTNWAISNGTNVIALGTYYATTTGGNTAANYLSTANVDVDSSPSISAGITINSLRFATATGRTLTLSGTNSIASGGILVTNTTDRLNVITGGTSLTSGNGNLTIIHNDPGAATAVTSTGNASLLTIATKITGAINLVKSGVGGLVINNTSNDFTGTIYVNGGAIVNSNTSANVNAVFGNAANTIVLNGGGLGVSGQTATAINRSVTLNDVAGNAFALASGSGWTMAGIISGPGTTNFGSIYLSGTSNTFGGTGKTVTTTSQVFTIAGDGSLGHTANSMTLAGANSAITAGNDITTNRNFILSGSTSSGISADDTRTFTINGNISGSANTRISEVIGNLAAGSAFATNFQAGTGSVVVFNGDNSGFTGVLEVRNGTLRIGSSAASPFGTIANGTTVSAPAAIDLNGTTISQNEAITIQGTGISSGGALLNSSATTATLAGLVSTNGNSSIVAGSGAIVLSNTGTMAGSHNLIITGSAAGSSIASIIGGGAGRSLTKAGIGSWTLTGASTYTGATAVNGGSLFVNGSLANTATAVGGASASGTPTLGGTGTINGAVTVNGAGGGAAGRLTAADIGTIGTLTIANALTTNAGSTLYFDIGVGLNNSDKLTGITALPTINGSLVLNFVGGSYTNTTYELINWTTANQLASAPTFTVEGADPGGTKTLKINTNGKLILELSDIGLTPAAFNVTAVPTFNVLRNAGGGSVSGSVTVLNTGTASGTANLTAGVIVSATSPGGSIAGGDSDSSGSVTLTTAGYANGSQNVSVTPAGASPTGTVNYVVGYATADRTNSQSTFGGALTATVTASGSYADLSSKAQFDGSGSQTRLGSEAILLLGTNATGGSETVSMAWRARTNSESNISLPTQKLYSDVVRLTGMDIASPNVVNGSGGEIRRQTDTFALQMTYVYAGPNESNLKLAWLNNGDGNYATEGDNTWVLATSGNFGIGTYVYAGLGVSWNDFINDTGNVRNISGDDGVITAANLANYLGSYGVNVAGDNVWAVLNHNSDFAVIPEPASLALVSLGALGLLARRRSR